MKRLLQLSILLAISTSAFSQTYVDASYAMTSEQNKDWLVRVRNADKDLQLILVKGRLFGNRQTSNPINKLDVPMLIIDGVPIEDNIDERQKEFLNTQLIKDNVDIQIIEKEPEGVYINKGFTGIVLIVITDKRVSKKFKRLK
jgi:hypothetical protein